MDVSVLIKIDLSMLINLKSIVLRCTKEKVENTLEFISDSSYNQLIKLAVDKTTIDFSKQIDLPELKCLHISNVDLSQQISNQCFNCMSNLIELNLDNTKLKNVEFLDTDRLENLKMLNLSHNQITVLRNGTFSKLKKLTRLDLSNNQIEELVQGVFEGLECLEYLFINSNSFNVESIDKTVFDELNCLKYLYILMENDNVDHLKRDGLNIY